MITGGELGSLVDEPFIVVDVGLLAYIYQQWCLGRRLGLVSSALGEGGGGTGAISGEGCRVLLFLLMFFAKYVDDSAIPGE